jgi:hypothetical protein
LSNPYTPRILPSPFRFSLLLIALALPLSAQRVLPQSRDVHVVEMKTATLDELARVEVAPPAGEHRERPHEQFAAVPAVRSNAIIASRAVTALVAPPPITRGFQAVTDPLPGAKTAYDPADTSGAAGPQHVVGAFNNAVTVHDRSGHLLSLVSAAQFWHDETLPDKTLYDPRVAYDAASDRWVILMLGDDAGQVNGVLLIAFSTSGNPAGGWRRFRLAIDQTGTLDGDLTHLAITADRIAVTVNAWSGDFPLQTNILMMQKSVAFSTSTLNVTARSLPYQGDLVPISSRDNTLRLAAYVSDNQIALSEVSPSGAILNQRGYSSASTSTFVPCAQLGGASPPDCGYATVLDGVARNNAIWVVTETNANAALVWKITGSTATTYVIQPPNLAVAFPSIAVNSRGSAVVGYTVMSSAIYPSAAYTYIDANGSQSTAAILKDGEAPFRRSRWGDFSTTVVDPLDDTSFWTVQDYANTPLTQPAFDRWATWWSYIQILPARGRAVRR